MRCPLDAFQVEENPEFLRARGAHEMQHIPGENFAGVLMSLSTS